MAEGLRNLREFAYCANCENNARLNKSLQYQLLCNEVFFAPPTVACAFSPIWNLQLSSSLRTCHLRGLISLKEAPITLAQISRLVACVWTCSLQWLASQSAGVNLHLLKHDFIGRFCVSSAAINNQAAPPSLHLQMSNKSEKLDSMLKEAKMARVAQREFHYGERKYEYCLGGFNAHSSGSFIPSSKFWVLHPVMVFSLSLSRVVITPYSAESGRL